MSPCSSMTANKQESPIIDTNLRSHHNYYQSSKREFSLTSPSLHQGSDSMGSEGSDCQAFLIHEINACVDELQKLARELPQGVSNFVLEFYELSQLLARLKMGEIFTVTGEHTGIQASLDIIRHHFHKKGLMELPLACLGPHQYLKPSPELTGSDLLSAHRSMASALLDERREAFRVLATCLPHIEFEQGEEAHIEHDIEDFYDRRFSWHMNQFLSDNKHISRYVDEKLLRLGCKSWPGIGMRAEIVPEMTTGHQSFIKKE